MSKFGIEILVIRKSDHLPHILYSTDLPKSWIPSFISRLVM